MKWREAEPPLVQALTLHTATACLENVGVHFHSGLRQQLVSRQVGVVWRGNEVVTQRLCHVLVHLIVLGVEDIRCGTAHVVGKTWRKKEIRPGVWSYLHVDVTSSPSYRWCCWCFICHMYIREFAIPSIPSTVCCRFSGQGSNFATMSTRCSLARPRICK